MHELAVTQGLLKICLEEGKKHNVKRCNKCNYKGEIGRNNYVCPKCKGNIYEITKGREFYLDTMEVD